VRLVSKVKRHTLHAILADHLALNILFDGLHEQFSLFLEILRASHNSSALSSFFDLLLEFPVLFAELLYLGLDSKEERFDATS